MRELSHDDNAAIYWIHLLKTFWSMTALTLVDDNLSPLPVA